MLAPSMLRTDLFDYFFHFGFGEGLLYEMWLFTVILT